MVNPTIISHPLWCGQMWLTNLVCLQWPAQVHRKTAQMQKINPSLAFGPIHSKNVEAKPVITNPSPEQTRKTAQLRRLWNLPWGGIPVSGKRFPGGSPVSGKQFPEGSPPGTNFRSRGPPRAIFKDNARFVVSSHALGRVQCALLNIETTVGHSSASQSIVMECRIAKQTWKLGLLKADQHLFKTKGKTKQSHKSSTNHNFGGVT